MQDNYIRIGKRYSVQQVSIKDALYKTSKMMRVPESKYFADDYHPTTYGHVLMKDCMMNLIKVIDEEETGPQIKLPEQDYMGADFKNLVMIDSNSVSSSNLTIDPGSFSDIDEAVVSMYYTKKASFPDNFYHKTGNENKPFKLTLNCKNILINYKTSNRSDFGKADFYVDGKLVTTADGYSSGGWNNCNVIIVENTGVDYPLENDSKFRFLLKKDNEPHIGLNNVKSRLAVSCGGSLTLSKRPNGGTIATIRIHISKSGFK